MTVHVGEIASEVSTVAPRADQSSAEKESEWEERVCLAAALERLERDRHRTATGYGDD